MNLRDEFENNLHMTYIDEVINYEFKSVSQKSIVSLTIHKKDYIEKLENDWSILRKKYCVPDGVCLHFTDIKALLDNNRFNEQKEKNTVFYQIFQKDGQLDTQKLYNFYQDILKIIESNNFKILIKNIRFTKPSPNEKKLFEKCLNKDWYISLKVHLDYLADYFFEKSLQEFKDSTKKHPKFKILKTKLRYDGDFGLTSKTQFRDAYAHAITTGTTNFNSEFISECFDSLKFIDKQQVGTYSYCEACHTAPVSHAGNELLDFIAFFASNNEVRDAMKSDYQKFKNASEIDAESYVNKNNRIFITDEFPFIFPYKSINKKIYRKTIDKTSL